MADPSIGTETDIADKEIEMGRIVLFRRMPGKMPIRTLSAKRVEEIKKTLKKTCRVKRDELVNFLLSGDLSKMDVTTQSVIDSPIRRNDLYEALGDAVGFHIPKGSLGRKGDASASQAESVRLWLKQNLAAFPELRDLPDKVSIVYIPDEEE